MKKYIYIISCFLLSALSAFAEDVKTINTLQDMETVVLPVDTAALDIASEKISDTDTAKNAFLNAIASKNKMVTSDVFVTCNGGYAIDFEECADFIREYLDILTNRTNCTKANKFTKFTNPYDDSGKVYSSVGDCYGLAGETKIRISKERAVRKDSAGYQCLLWVEAAEKCQIYLTYHYKDKLLDPDITKKEQKKYKCILDKLETGNIEFPTSKMEQSCK